MADGRSPADVVKETGSPAAAVKRYATELTAGATEIDTKPYYGKDWSTADLARLHGLWGARHKSV